MANQDRGGPQYLEQLRLSSSGVTLFDQIEARSSSADSLSIFIEALHADVRARWLYALAKRMLDVGVALVALSIALPFLVAVAVIVKLTSRGPVLYGQTRIGRHGRPFECLKFRTMVQHADSILEGDAQLREAFSVAWKLPNDRRVTRVGKILRQSSIDELPQLINVLRGEMSIVGPRPVQPREIELFGRLAPVVMCVRPGLTSLWAISGRSLMTYQERVRLEAEYVRRRRFSFDLYVIAMTIPAVVTRRGAI